MCKPRQTKRGQESPLSPSSSPARPRPRTPRRPEAMARKGVSYVTAAQLVSMVSDPRVAIIDVRDEERICDAHIAGSHHYASDGFADRLPEIAEATRAKDTLVFHCALSQVGARSILCKNVPGLFIRGQGRVSGEEHHGPRAWIQRMGAFRESCLPLQGCSLQGCMLLKY
ncbi:arsenate reductase 2.1-like isoform X1 [Triticum dicoccoides]|uniref:arsenate reductase 2.1-like isoform X1 n=1 Tax=Triticum dicoccoides TaxID=85692 RepID=UPI00188EBE9A|nr:arsenate reductase 2.1-like isoform X1 [Triticum dicoccoides]XP_044371994.1 arsenate reductase 2.1-like isoform X1 [Triticum aestivum]